MYNNLSLNGLYKVNRTEKNIECMALTINNLLLILSQFYKLNHEIFMQSATPENNFRLFKKKNLGLVVCRSKYNGCLREFTNKYKRDDDELDGN